MSLKLFVIHVLIANQNSGIPLQRNKTALGNSQNCFTKKVRLAINADKTKQEWESVGKWRQIQ